MTARTDASSLMSCQASARRQSISALIAFRTSGRFMVTVAMPSALAKRTAGSEGIAHQPDREVLRAAAVGVAEGVGPPFHLVLAGAPHHLERRLAQAEHARGADRVRAEHPARRVDGQVRAHLLLAALDDLPALARVAEAQVLEPHGLEPGEGDVHLDRLDLLPRVLDARLLVDLLGAEAARLRAHLVAARHPHRLGVGVAGFHPG